jgi:hypothetical protein
MRRRQSPTVRREPRGVSRGGTPTSKVAPSPSSARAVRTDDPAAWLARARAYRSAPSSRGCGRARSHTVPSASALTARWSRAPGIATDHGATAATGMSAHQLALHPSTRGHGDRLGAAQSGSRFPPTPMTVPLAEVTVSARAAGAATTRVHARVSAGPRTAIRPAVRRSLIVGMDWDHGDAFRQRAKIPRAVAAPPEQRNRYDRSPASPAVYP